MILTSDDLKKMLNDEHAMINCYRVRLARRGLTMSQETERQIRIGFRARRTLDIALKRPVGCEILNEPVTAGMPEEVSLAGA